MSADKTQAEKSLKRLQSLLSGKAQAEDEAEAGDENDKQEPVTKQQKMEDEEDRVEEDLSNLDSIPRVSIHRIESEQGKCTHEVAYPPGVDYRPLMKREGPAAREFTKFILDPFQQQSIKCIDNRQSVLVSAHTSAGKTVVAEYAIATSLRDKQRVIYTSPIKALSNQKFREMFDIFDQDVGLMTGDVTINPSASCIVMTTEILRSMLYRGSEMMREVGWVVFDEIHYMRDKERGYVWEETIILLPDSVKYVFLSATIPNARQFAEWVCYLHSQPCHVVYTDYRPVPLMKYIYPSGGDGLYMVVDKNDKFNDENFTRAMQQISSSGSGPGGRGGGRRPMPQSGQESHCYKLVKMIMEKGMQPCIVFSFSRKDCEAYAMQVAKIDMNEQHEKKLVDEVFYSAIDILSEEDKALPQVKESLPLLRRGIGIHHSGLLPILKETIEILFGEGLIKVLFATETFSMGLNMPARTVLFTSCRKFDGRDFRNITSGEFIQMSGRAGRRGKDDRGIVILMVDQQLQSDSAKEILKGAADPLNSQFRLTYNMVLNLLRVEGINPEFMLERSFYQFQNYASLPDLYRKVQTTRDALREIQVPQEMEITGYHRLKQQIADIESEIQNIVVRPKHIVKFLKPGRLVQIRNGEDNFGYGMIVHWQTKKPRGGDSLSDPVYVVDVLLPVSKSSFNPRDPSSVKPCPVGGLEDGDPQIIPTLLPTIARISSVVTMYPDDLKPLANRQRVIDTVKRILDKFPEGPPSLDPVTDMEIKDKEVKDAMKKLTTLRERLQHHHLKTDPNLMRIYDVYKTKLAAEQEYSAAKQQLKKAQSLLQLEDLKCRKRVLRRMQYCDASDVITLKGRVACEVSAADELLLTEMLFNGAFNDIDVHQTAALLSCFVFEEKGEMPKLADDLSGILRQMHDTARRVAKVQIEAKLDIGDEEKYVEKFKPYMMDVVSAWSKGATFAELCKMTDSFEGSIIRCLRRLEELLREAMNTAKTIGNADLEKKFAEAGVRIKRDIVFAASLYT